jgi:hypothetical protein
MMHGVDAHGDVCASGDEVTVNVERLLVVDGLLAPESACHGRRDAERLVDARAEEFAAIQLRTDDDVLAAGKRGADLFGQPAVSVWSTREVEEERRESCARGIAAWEPRSVT